MLDILHAVFGEISAASGAVGVEIWQIFILDGLRISCGDLRLAASSKPAQPTAVYILKAIFEIWHVLFKGLKNRLVDALRAGVKDVRLLCDLVV